MDTTHMTWQYPWCLLLLIPLWRWAYRRPRPLPHLILAFPFWAAVPTESKGARWIRWQRIRLGMIGTLGLVALASPGTHQTRTQWVPDQLSIVVVMDTSRSMLATDFKPNRLEQAKTLTHQLITQTPHAQWSVVAMGAYPLTMIPLTMDHAMVHTRLQSLTPSLTIEGSHLGLGIGTALKRLKASRAPHQWVVVWTDGTDTGPSAFTQWAAQQCKQQGVRLAVMGLYPPHNLPIPLGNPESGPYYERHPDGTLVLPMRQLDVLHRMAQHTGGRFESAHTPTDATRMIQGVRSAFPPPQKETVLLRWISFTPWVLSLALCLMLGEIFSGSIRWRTLS